MERESRSPQKRSDTPSAPEAGRRGDAPPASELAGRVTELEARMVGFGRELSRLKTGLEEPQGEIRCALKRGRAAQVGLWLLAQRVLRSEARTQRRRQRSHLRWDLTVAALAEELKGIEAFVYSEFLWVGPEALRESRFQGQRCQGLTGPDPLGIRLRGGVWPKTWAEFLEKAPPGTEESEDEEIFRPEQILLAGHPVAELGFSDERWEALIGLLAEGDRTIAWQPWLGAGADQSRIRRGRQLGLFGNAGVPAEDTEEESEDSEPLAEGKGGKPWYSKRPRWYASLTPDQQLVVLGMPDPKGGAWPFGGDHGFTPPSKGCTGKPAGSRATYGPAGPPEERNRETPERTDEDNVVWGDRPPFCKGPKGRR